jgi:hypothetical protein
MKPENHSKYPQVKFCLEYQKNICTNEFFVSMDFNHAYEHEPWRKIPENKFKKI